GPDEPDNEEFGQILEELRFTARLSRLQAAERLGLSSEYIRLIERGKRAPAAGKMPHILHVYGKECILERAGEVQFDDYIVKFTSRIQEARRKSTPENMSFHTRTQKIGQIMTWLVVADNETIDKVQKLLRVEN
ncbi:MAG TPA: helix-turn-helix transcriptional regulator, partial [Anaerolineales bacterium]|nr:helix-turn-helix transcriptional regulator [Anaerolineales bacterium]